MPDFAGVDLFVELVAAKRDLFPRTVQTLVADPVQNSGDDTSTTEHYGVMRAEMLGILDSIFRHDWDEGDARTLARLAKGRDVPFRPKKRVDKRLRKILSEYMNEEEGPVEHENVARV